MLSIRSFSALCLVTVCVVIAAVLVSGDSGAIPGSGKPLFPELLSRLNDVEEVRVAGASGRFMLERSESGWTAPEKFGYPADADKIHKLLVGAAGLHRVEPKTSDPSRYPKLGLADPAGETSRAISYQLVSGTDSTIAALIVGNTAPAKGDPELSEFYVRLPDDPRVWLVEGKLPSGDSLIDWLQSTVADIDRARVRTTEVVHASGEVVTVARETPAEGEFRLVNAPPGKTVDGQWKLNDIGRLFSKLELEDLRPRDEAPVEGEPDFVVTMDTFDGLIVRMKVYEHDGQTLGTLNAESQPQASEAVRAEAERLNARWARWAYVLPGFKVDAIARSRSELLKDPGAENDPEQS